MKKIILAFSLSLVAFQNFAQQIQKPTLTSKTSFAIVVDDATYQQAKDEIAAYQASIEKDGLGTYIVSHTWQHPQEVKDILKSLYTNAKQPLEGAVFIGNIPIPMIREAQVLTSAFKTNEKIKWERSSVASDRYYDDFDLQFEYLNKDEHPDRALYHYFRLHHDSPHYIQMDIYTGRIKPAIHESTADAVTQIKAYLQKLVKVREENNALNHLLVSTGHGYNSNSQIGWGNELIAFRSAFSNLFTQGNSVKFLHYKNATFLKNNLVTELNREDLDLAYMTGHGTEKLQLLNGYPDASAPQPSMENVGRYIRSKMNSAKTAGRDLEQVKAGFQRNLGLNDKWFDDAFSPERAIEDSLFNEALDIHAKDLKQVNARVVYLNSCLTGSFHKKDYLAAAYPFSEGKTVVAFANSVGVLQDLWGPQLLGILQYGSRVGHLLKKTAYLETHIMGDPTFHFSAPDATSLNQILGSTKTPTKQWKAMLKSDKADLQAYALTELYHTQPEASFSQQLLHIFNTSPYESVRTQAYYLLRRYNNAHFKEALVLALNDNYEYLRRKALYDVNDSEPNKYLEALAERYISDQHLARSIYKINWIFQFIDQAKLIDLFKEKLNSEALVYNKETLLKDVTKKLLYEQQKEAKIKAVLQNTSTAPKELLDEIKTMRLYRRHSLVNDLLLILERTNCDKETKLAILEAVSWFGMSYQRDHIMTSLKQYSLAETDLEVKQKALKAIRSLEDASKRPF